MDTSRYHQLFVAECREMLQALNLTVVQLESDASDAAVIDEVFRHAHSLKGVSSTMGYDAMAALTHEMEHVLEQIRVGSGEVSREVIDIVLECVDLLESAVDNIDEGGDEGIDTSGLIARLQAIDVEGSIAQAGEVSSAGGDDGGGSAPPESSAPSDMAGINVRVHLVEDCESASIRAFMVFTVVEKFGAIQWSAPDAEDVDDFDGRLIRILIDPELGFDEVELIETISRIAEVASVDVASTDDEPQSTPSAETEAAAEAILAADGAVDVPSSGETEPPPDLGGLLITVQLAPDCESASIRAFMIANAAQSWGDIEWSSPAVDDLDSFEGFTISILLATAPDTDEAQLSAALERITEVESVVMRTQDPSDPAPAADDTDDAVVAAAPIQTTEEIVPEGPIETAVVTDANAEAAAATPGEGAEPAPAAEVGERRKAPKRRLSGTVRVDAARLDKLMHLMGEVVVHRTNVEAQLRRNDMAKATEAVQELRRSTQSLQAEVMNVRMVPVETVFMRMPRLVRDLSTRLGKQVDLQIVGADTEIDRSVVDALSDPLVHMVRNSLDHGIEVPEVRAVAGKEELATLRITAGHSGGNVVITVEDDGAGIDAEAVKARAVERGLIGADMAASLDHDGAIELVFMPGFSTVVEATEISGRGVGMDAVRTLARELGGEISIASVVGEGTVAQLSIPLTLAVMTVLVVDVNGIRLALPIDRVERTVRMADYQVTESGALKVVAIDDGTLELIDLGDHVGYGATEETRYGVIVHGRAGRKILSVTTLIGEYETVTRPLPRVSGDRAVFMGGSVQSDGAVVLIVNVDGVFEGDIGRSGGYNAFAFAGRG